MRSKASQQRKDRKRIARRRKNVKCHNMGVLYGNAARVQQEVVATERKTFWMAIKEMFEGLNRGPRRSDQKEWERD